MAYSKINIVIKKPSQSLERRIREIGRRKYERLQQMRKDWESGVSEESKPTLAKCFFLNLFLHQMEMFTR